MPLKDMFNHHTQTSYINMDTPSNNYGAVHGGRKNSSTTGSVLSAHNINYKVAVQKSFYGAKVEKQILTDVTAVFKQGMTAIMGPTGSGKSSLMDILARRNVSPDVSGHLLIDGMQVPPNYKCMVGYVVQDDRIMGTLTVKENIHFSAALRLHASMTIAERNEQVNSVIKELGLEKCAETKVGTEFIRGVSGGERKRCSIGMELIISPAVLFLDEPTTGLDSDTAYTVLRLIKRLSSRGRTIILTIHQPRYSIFCLFDDLLLLSGGNVVYYGPSKESLDFFALQGYRCEQHNNPPDFFMDVMNGNLKQSDDTIRTDITDNVIDGYSKHDIRLIEGFKQSEWNKRLQEESAAILSKYKTEVPRIYKHSKLNYATSFVRQIQVLAARSLKNIVRDPQICMLNIGGTVFFAAIIIAIFWQVKEDPATAFKDRSGVLFFLIVNQLFFNMTAIEVFIKERAIFMHESISGFYRVSAYFLVKTTFDIIPMRITPVIIMTALIYDAVGLHRGADHFFMLMFSLFCLTMAGAGFSFFMCSTVPVFSIVQMISALVYTVMMLLGGFMVSLESIGPWLNWAKYFSFFKYAQSALYINEFKGRQFCTNGNVTICVSGNYFLRNQQMDFQNVSDFWINNIVLLSFSLAFMVLSYIQLRRMKKTV